MVLQWSTLNARNLEFWAVEVKRNVPHMVLPVKAKVVHLTHASLGAAKGKGKGIAIGTAQQDEATLFVQVDREKVVLGTLIPHLLPQQQFDMIFERGCQLWHNWEGSVFFSGYMADRPPNEYPSIGEFEQKAKQGILQEEPHNAVVDSEPKSSKKRASGSGITTHGQNKKAKVTTQETDGKQAENTPATKPNWNPQSGKFKCDRCKKEFVKEKGLVSHQLAKHS